MCRFKPAQIMVIEETEDAKKLARRPQIFPEPNGLGRADRIKAFLHIQFCSTKLPARTQRLKNVVVEQFMYFPSIPLFESPQQGKEESRSQTTAEAVEY